MFKPIVLAIALAFSPLALGATPLVAYPLAPSPQSAATQGKMTTKPENLLLRLPPPTMEVTRAVRRPDGSIQLQCVQRLNPRSGLARQRAKIIQPDASH